MAEEIAAVRNMLTADRNYGALEEAELILEQAEQYADELRDTVLRWHRDNESGDHEVRAEFCRYEPCKVAAGW